MPPKRQSPSEDLASNIFVNRETPKKTFRDAALAIPNDGCLIRTWYGVGGQGKTALARELFRLASGDEDESYKHIRRGMVDLHGKAIIDPDLLMVWIRNAFAKSGVSFPAFDVAFNLMWEKTRGEETLPIFHKPWLKKSKGNSGEVTSDLITLTRETVEQTAETIPGLGLLIKKGVNWVIDRGTEHYLKKNRPHLNDILENGELKSGEKLRELMPWMLAQELNQHLSENPDERFVLFVDEYESILDAGGMGKLYNDNKFDNHMRKFIAETNGLLALFFSRERLHWADRGEDKQDWSDDLKDSQHLLGGLSSTDADKWLYKIPVENSEMRNAMVEGARENAKPGAPIYPLLLDLQVERFKKLGSKAAITDFNVEAESFEGRLETLVTRLLRDYEKGVENVLLHLAIPTRFDREVFEYVVEKNNIQISVDDYERLKELSIVTVDDDNWLSLHRAVADAIVQLHKERQQEWQESLLRHFVKRSNPEKITNVDNATLVAFTEATRLRLKQGLNGYVDWFSETIDQIEKAGKYYFLENEWSKIFNLLKKELGEEHPDTLTTRSNLAVQLGDLGNYEEAANEYRAVYTIRRKELGEEHPSTLTTRNNLEFVLQKVKGQVKESKTEFL